MYTKAIAGRQEPCLSIAYQVNSINRLTNAGNSDEISHDSIWPPGVNTFIGAASEPISIGSTY